MSHNYKKEKNTLDLYILVFILLASGIAVSGYISYLNFKRQYREEVTRELSSIAELKANGLVNWRKERLIDAETLQQNTSYSILVKAYLENPGDSINRAQIEAWLKNYRLYSEYDEVRLLDTHGQTLLSDPAALQPIAPDVMEQIPEVLKSKQATTLDFYRREIDQKIRLSLLIPIIDTQTGDQVIGLVALSINPEVYLYPFIKEWPTTSTTAETLLIRREGNEALFLNELRFNSNSSLSLHFPLTSTQLPAVKAVLGQTGIAEGLDYRGNQVLADVRPIPDSPWFLVSKMDISEVYAPLTDRLWLTFTIIGLAIFLAGVALMAIWRQQSIRLYRTKIESTRALAVSEEKFRKAFNTSPDTMIIVRLADGVFVSVNKGFEQNTGYTQEQVVGKKSSEFNIWKNPDDQKKMIEVLQTKGEVRNFEAPFITQNGEIHGVLSASIIELGGEPHILTVTHDITDRKQAEEALKAEQSLMQSLMDNVPVQIYFKDLKGRFIRINTAQAKLFSLSDPNQAVGKTDFDFFLSEHAQQAFDDEQKILQTGQPITKLEKETWEGFPNTWVTTTKLPLRNKDEKIIGTFGISIDVTDLKYKEELLEEDRNLLSTLIENLPDSVYVKKSNGAIIVDNIAHRHMLGATSLEQVVGKTDFDFFPKERAASYRASEEQVIQSGESLIDKEEPYIDHNGDQRWLSTTKVPLRDSDGKVTGIVGINHDITQRKHAIDAVFKSEKQLKETQIIAGLGNYRFDFSAGTWESSDVLDVIFGIDKTFERSIEGWAEIIHPTDRQQMTDYLANDVIGKHTHFDKEYRIVRINDRVERWVHGLGELEFDAQNKLTVMLGTIRDITERKQAELMIEAHLQLVDFAMHHSLDEVLVKTLDEICDLTGSPIGFYHFIEPDQVTLSLQAWSTRTTQEYCKAEGKGSHYNIDQAGVWVECFHQRQPVIHNDYASLPTSRRKGLPEGHAELVRELAVPIMRNDLVVAILGIGNKTQNYTEKDIEIATYFADVVWEIVERKRAEQQLAKHTEHLEELVDERTRELRETQQQLVRQERLATMGQLAGSIGHELRNPLGVITNAVYYLKMAEPNANDKVKEYLDIIEKEARTSDKIITDLLDFTRIKALDRQPASVSELIHQTFERYYAPGSVNVELEIPAALPQIYADPLHVVQILINLVSNACQSMSPADTANEVSNVGKLTVTASVLGDMIKIDVQDTGTGILPENMKKIFEPLFTTKTKGIGLGLAVSQKLAEANGGRIEVQSEAGKGSIFSVYFPKYRQESQ